MPKRDPFADKRRTSNGVPPKQAKIQIQRKIERTAKRKYKVVEDLKIAKRELGATEREILVKKEMLALIAEAPSPAEQRKIIMATFKESNFNPIESLIEMALDKDADLSDKDRAGIINNLAGYFAPKPKTIDLQADMKSSVTVSVMDYSKTTQAELKAVAEQCDNVLEDAKIIDVVTDEDYNEFEAPEDQIAD